MLLGHALSGSFGSYLTECFSWYGFFRSSFGFGFRRSSSCYGLHRYSSCSSLRPACCDCCSFGCFRHYRPQPRLLLSGGEWQHPFGQPPSATLSIAKRRPCARLCATNSWCPSFPDPIHSFCRRRLPCSPSPKRAVPPHVVRHHAPRSLLRCVRLSASACWCRTTYHPVAWS